eukprot:6438334-Alexandrium_andersonii.AAC.1
MEVVVDDADDAPAIGGAGSRGTTASEVVMVDDGSAAPDITADGGKGSLPGSIHAPEPVAPAVGGS